MAHREISVCCMGGGSTVLVTRDCPSYGWEVSVF